MANGTVISVVIPNTVEILPANPLSTSTSIYTAYTLTLTLTHPLSTMTSTTATVYKRYSELLKLHQTLTAPLAAHPKPAPIFPPKVMGKLSDLSKGKRKEG